MDEERQRRECLRRIYLQLIGGAILLEDGTLDPACPLYAFHEAAHANDGKRVVAICAELDSRFEGLFDEAAREALVSALNQIVTDPGLKPAAPYVASDLTDAY